MREALRLAPTAPLRSVIANEDTTIGGGKYFISKGRVLVVNTDAAQRDPKVYGEDVSSLSRFLPTVSNLPQANEFRPERMLDGKFEALPVCPYLSRVRHLLTKYYSPTHGNPSASVFVLAS